MKFPETLDEFRRDVMTESLRRTMFNQADITPDDDLFITLKELNEYLEKFNRAITSQKVCSMCHKFHEKSESCR